ncbi:MAG TPA: hypothetical protein PLW40_09305 [Syntrophales bacterium]|nr:hypothetical protein [Syntrophales bacterium]
MTYVQFAHNVRDRETRSAKARVLHTFGRTDTLDIGALKRLAKSISRFLTPEEARQIQGTTHGEGPLQFVKSVPMGGAYRLRLSMIGAIEPFCDRRNGTKG